MGLKIVCAYLPGVFIQGIGRGLIDNADLW